MSTETLSATACLAILSIILSAGCQHLGHARRDLVLERFSDRNYAELDRRLGAISCIRGTIYIDSIHRSVYFPLESGEDDGVITIGISRIISGLSYDYALRSGMVDGESYRVCGVLRDATPFRQCDDPNCKWYKLENAELQ